MTDRIPKVNLNDVLRIIERDFPNCDSKTIMDILREYPKEESYRVYSAALKLSGGNVEKLRKWIDVAKVDFRDVISPAEYPRFHELGFVGVDKLSRKEVAKLKKDDWKQYQDWLKRKT
jgi:hypothetical protein